MNKPFIICIVDDDQVHQFTLSKTLELKKLARKVLVFSDGEEALEFMNINQADKDNLPDIIFLDINMPIMDGFEFMEEYAQVLPRLNKRIIVYMLTSSVDPSDLERANRIKELHDYIIKPLHPDDLSDLINSINNIGENQ